MSFGAADESLALTLDGAAYRVGVSRRTIQHWIHQGFLASFIEGKRRYVRLADLVAYDKARWAERRAIIERPYKPRRRGKDVSVHEL